MIKTLALRNIQTIIDQLYNEPFPSEWGKEVQGVDLVLIDTDIMELVSRFLDSRGQLTTDEINMLDSCFSDLDKILPQLDKNEKSYFDLLRQLAKNTLDSIQTFPPPGLPN